MRKEILNEADRLLIRSAAEQVYGGDPIQFKLIAILDLLVALDPVLGETRETLSVALMDKMRLALDVFFERKEGDS